MIADINKAMFSAGSTVGATIAFLFAYVFPGLVPFLIILYMFLAGVSIYNLRDEFRKFLE